MSASEYREIPLDLVDEPEAQSRLVIDEGDLADLIDSMRAHGQLQPGGVVPNGERFTVSFGHRRLLAARALQLPFYKANVYASTSEAMLGAQLDENVIRADLEVVEAAYWFAQLLDAIGGDVDVLCAKLKKSRDYVESRLNLLTGDPAVLDALAKKRISFAVAKRLNAYRDDGDRLVLLDAAAAGGATDRLVATWIAERKAIAASRGILPAIDPSVAPSSPVPADEHQLRCGFCRSTEHVYLMKPVWLHSTCSDILDAIIARHLGGVHVEAKPSDPAGAGAGPADRGNQRGVDRA